MISSWMVDHQRIPGVQCRFFTFFFFPQSCLVVDRLQRMVGVKGEGYG